jgi:NADH-quinone oxidoreductase subunit I
MAVGERSLNKARRRGFGLGLLKGLGITFKHLFKRNTVIQYPDEKQDLGPRTRGVIALKEENCTVCMLCARECPDWCIYIDSHKETLPPKREGGRPRKRNVLDRFAIDYALCMYCGICVEVCPYDALFWSREFEYAEYDIRELTHEKERLSDWMATVLPPPPLDEGAEQPGVVVKPAPVAAATAPPATKPAETSPKGATIPAASPTLAPEGATDVDTDRLPPPPTGDKAGMATVTGGEPEETEATPEESQGDADPEAPSGAQLTEEQKASYAESPGPNVEVPIEDPRPVSLEEPVEDAQAVFDSVLKEQLDKGSSRQVAEARARVARAKAERGIKRGPTPVEVEKPVPSAPTKGRSEPEPSGAPKAETPQPDPGPVAAQEDQVEPQEPAAAPQQEAAPKQEPAAAPQQEAAPKQEPAAAPQQEAAPKQEPAAAPSAPAGGGESPDDVYARVYAAEKEKGSSDAVATGRAKAARVKAERAQKGGG